MQLLRFWHTVRWLRPVQFYGRLRHRLYRPRLRTAGPATARATAGRWMAPLSGAATLLGPARFRFLGQEREVTVPGDWDNPGWALLWRYHLHAFDDLNAGDAPARADWHRELIGRWVAENPPGAGTGWDSHPTSRRIVNWIKWALAGNALEPAWAESLALQAEWLRRRVEWHLLGNHVLANLKALVFASLYFEGRERTLAAALRQLERQLAEQVLDDGGHFERSPMYHAIVLEDVLDLLNLSRAWPGLLRSADAGWWADLAQDMLRWLDALRHPDGSVALFNDTAFDGGPEPAALGDYAARLGVRTAATPGALAHLATSGYVRAERGPAVLIADIGPVGPDCQPGHGHADTLSFELSLAGLRLFVNSGCSLYEAGAERLRQRGTLAHNTVCVDGQDSSEVWNSFRVARRARPFGVACRDAGSALEIMASHDGYRRLPGRVIHRREWRLHADRLEIQDRLSGPFREAVASFHCHPDIACEKAEDDVVLTGPGGTRARLSVRSGRSALEPSTWHPEFGSTIPNQVIRVTFEGPELTTVVRWDR